MARNCTRPNITHWNTSVRVWRIESTDLFLRLFQYDVRPLLHHVGKEVHLLDFPINARLLVWMGDHDPELLRPLQCCLLDEHRYGIVIIGIRLTSQAESLQRDRSSSREWVKDLWWRVSPLVFDHLLGFPDVLVIPILHGFPGNDLLDEFGDFLSLLLVIGEVYQCRKIRCPGGGQGAAGPPDVEGGGVTVSDILLSGRGC